MKFLKYIECDDGYRLKLLDLTLSSRRQQQQQM
jgi:hypothetical protein